MSQQVLERARVEGVELEYEDRGTGEPVVLMHAGVCAEWFKPLMEEPALSGDYRRSATTGSATPAAAAWPAR